MPRGSSGDWPLEDGLMNLSTYLRTTSTLEERYKTRDEIGPLTYTQALMVDQNARVKKLGTEAVEFVREDNIVSFSPVNDSLIGEAADLVYSAEVMVASRDLEWRNVLREVGRRAVTGEGAKDQAYQYGALNFNTSIALIDWRAAGLRAGRLPQTETERLLADKDARQAKLGADVMALVGAETVASFKFKEETLVNSSASVIYDVAVMVAAKGRSFTEVVDELIRRNRPQAA